MKITRQGQVTIGVGILMSSIAMTGGILASYFTSQNLITVEISRDRERLAKLEEAITTIKETQGTTQKDVKEILRLLK